MTHSLMLAVFAFMFFSCDMINYPGFKKTKSGIYYKIHKDNDSDTARVRTGSIVTMVLQYGTKDSSFFNSVDMPEPILIPIIESQYEGDLYEGLKLLKQGDSATFILKAGPVFTTTFQRPTLPDNITEESDFYFNVKINKVQTEEEIQREIEIENMVRQKEEMARLEQYITENAIQTSPTTTGLYFIETKKGTGKSPVQDGYCSAHYTVTILDGNRLFSSYDKNEAVDFKVGSQFENEGFQEAIRMMKEGGKATVIIPSSMAFGAQGMEGFVPPFSTLVYEIELVKVMSEQEWEKKRADREAKKQAEKSKFEQEGAQAIQKYLNDNNLTPTVTLPNGLIYVEKQAGTGPKPVNGKKVKVHYTGMLLNGTKFDSSVERGTPLDFTIGQREVIQGWDQGIALMNQGAKGILIVPSKLGYGERGAGNAIPPNSPLVFEVELVEAEQ